MIYKSIGELIQGVEAQIQQTMSNDYQLLEDFLIEIIQTAIEKEVYDAHTPVTYERRGNLGGLSDPRNIKITSTEFTTRGVMLTVENITKASDDDSQGLFTSHLIEYGTIANNSPLKWDVEGVWSEPRPFMQRAKDDLGNTESARLRQIVMHMFMQVGWKFK